ASGHLAVNVLLHGFNAGLLFLFLLRATGAAWPSLMVALLFAVHPLNVETVAWASQRKSTLSTLFFFLTLHGWLGYTKNRSWLAYVASLTAYALGLMAKPMLVTLPGVLVLLDGWPLRRFTWKKEVLAKSAVEKAPFLVLALATAGVLWVPWGALANSSRGHPVTVASVANALVNVAIYLRKTVLPFDLAVLYPHRSAVSAIKVASALLLILGISAVTLLRRNQTPSLLVGWLWFLGTLFPVSGVLFIGPHELADRYAYLPVIGLFIMAAWAIPSRFWTETPLFSRTVLAAIILFFGAVAWHQTGFWKNSVTLWERDAAVTPVSSTQQMNLGNALLGEGRDQEAEPCFHLAAKLEPNDARPYIDLALISNRRGNRAGAVELLQKAIAIEPREARAHNNLGSLLQDLGRNDEASIELKTALTLNPSLAEAHLNLGVLLATQGNLTEAVQRFETAAHLRPGDPVAEQNLALARAQLAAATQARR
ncbi:MAG TPA: tetratricopeptide repeat protein, partial [Opitutaceae bacterium]|nr:tetratricopeptide repeat protein [Opitutaceae bacterium]